MTDKPIITPEKTVITVEIEHGESPAEITKAIKIDLANAIILEHIGEYSIFGDWPKYTVSINGEKIGEYNHDNDYTSVPD